MDEALDRAELVSDLGHNVNIEEGRYREEAKALFPIRRMNKKLARTNGFKLMNIKVELLKGDGDDEWVTVQFGPVFFLEEDEGWTFQEGRCREEGEPRGAAGRTW